MKNSEFKEYLAQVDDMTPMQRRKALEILTQDAEKGNSGKSEAPADREKMAPGEVLLRKILKIQSS